MYRNVINVRFYGHVAFFRKLRSVFRKGPNTALTPIAALLKSAIPVTLSVIASIMIHYYTIFYAVCQYFFVKKPMKNAPESAEESPHGSVEPRVHRVKMQ